MTDDHADAAPRLESAPGARAVIDGVEFDYFGGTGYLGLQSHPQVIEAAVNATRAHGVHTATSRTRLVSPWLEESERAAARFFGHAAGYHFGSGYVGAGILARLAVREDTVVLVATDGHYCSHDAASGSGRPVVPFPPDDLAATLDQHVPVASHALVLADGVHASSGVIGPVSDYWNVLESREGPSTLIVDDAHGFGVLGDNGRGTVEHHGLWSRANLVDDDARVQLFVTGTLSKALGGFGGILTGCVEFIARCRDASHWFDGATPPPVPVAAASATALDLAAANPDWRATLRKHASRVRATLDSLGVPTHEDPTPIVGFDLGSRERNLGLHDALRKAGIYVPYASSYAGLGANGSMRLALFSTHSDSVIDALLDALCEQLEPGP